MQISSIFFDQERWSIYATCNVAIILAFFLLSKQQITYQLLICMSILGMMKGNLQAKLIYTCFLNFLIYKNTINWKYASITLLMGVFITHYIPNNHVVQTTIQETPFLLWLFRTIVIVWIVFIFHLMYKSHE